MTAFESVAKAILFIEEHYIEQPSLKKIAAQVHLSEEHFQKMFTKWSGISPKKYLQWITLNKAKQLIELKENSLYDVTLETGLSSSARLHDLFINFEGISPGDYKNHASEIEIFYAYYESPFGKMILATTKKGICFLMFSDSEEAAFNELKKAWPESKRIHDHSKNEALASEIFSGSSKINLFCKGTKFQLSVWRALIMIDSGKTESYQSIASNINNSKANRAVASAIGKNSIAYLIPCHRVIRKDGNIGQYRWGIHRKRSILNYELCQNIKNYESNPA